MRYLYKINMQGIPLTIEHHYPLGDIMPLLEGGDLASPYSWDLVREKHPHFRVETNRERWVKQCEIGIGKDGQDGHLVERAYSIIDICQANGFTKIHSIGVGEAALEYQIKRLRPSLRMIASEYAPNNVETLRTVFQECDRIIHFDMLTGDWLEWSNGSNLLILMYRVDPHLSNKEWRQVFESMYKANVLNVLYMPSGFLTLGYAIVEERRYLKHKLLRKGISFAGYVRTKSTFERFWQGLYLAREGNLYGIPSFLLKKKGGDER